MGPSGLRAVVAGGCGTFVLIVDTAFSRNSFDKLTKTIKNVFARSAGTVDRVSWTGIRNVVYRLPSEMINLG